jgi:hypothetical protein
MNVASMIPLWTLNDKQKSAHLNVLTNEQNDANSPVISGEWFKMTLYGAYSHQVHRWMQSPFLREARLHGFQPLFLCKNVSLACGIFHPKKYLMFCHSGPCSLCNELKGYQTTWASNNAKQGGYWVMIIVANFQLSILQIIR